MKVTGYGNIRSGSGTKKTGNTSGTSSFADILALSDMEGANAAAPTSDISGAALSNLLSLQEISEEDVKRKKLLTQGKNMLDSLEQLRQQLLIGNIPLHVMQDMARQLAVDKQLIESPEVNDIIEEIELRLAVELAKLEMATRDHNQF